MKKTKCSKCEIYKRDYKILVESANLPVIVKLLGIIKEQKKIIDGYEENKLRKKDTDLQCNS